MTQPTQRTGPKTWLITGVSSGFGRCFVEELVKAGENVIGTLRKPDQVKAFQQEFGSKASFVLLDVDHPEQIRAAVAEIAKTHERIDVLVNNAGYGLFGAVEEASEAEARAQMETNFFGALAMTQAVLPLMRKQRSGHIVQFSSVAGFCGTPGLGLYNASKFALEGFSEALAQEVGPMGIQVLLVEPGPYRTKWAGGGAKDAAGKIADYAETAHRSAAIIQGYDGNQPGDPNKAVRLIMKVVNTANAPLRLPLGKMAIDRMRSKMEQLQKEIAAWEAESVATVFNA